MTSIHGYELTARAGCEKLLAQSLRELAATLEACPGNSTVLLLHQLNAGRFQLIEIWEDEAAREAAGAKLTKELMSPVLNAIDGPPITSKWQRLRS